MKGTLLTLAVGVAIGAAAVAAPALGSRHAAKRDLTMRTGDTLSVPTLDVFCSLWRSDPDGRLTGPVIYCNRSSVNHSWGVIVSRRWIETGSPQGYVVWKHARLP
jgi:hypothetical protein